MSKMLSVACLSRRLAASLFVSLSLCSSSLPVSWAWNMKPVTSLQGRVIGQPPTFTAGQGWSMAYPFSSVNTASLEGVLKFVHTECINWSEVRDQCQRKNGANYVVFFSLTFANPNGSLAYYEDPNVMNGEYGAYVTFDGGQCHGQEECYEFYGRSDATLQAPALGPYVGAKADDTDVRAPYPGGWWFSLPGECPTEPWKTKTKECVAAQPSGRCPEGKVPDGVQCTWSYTILGYVNIDDLVGIRDMINPNTGQRYQNYTEWCRADFGNNIEFDRDPATNEMIRGLEFWADPLNKTANWERYQRLLSVYSDTSLYPNNVPLPALDALRTSNPKCHQNLINCQPASGGCYRDNRMTCRSCRVSKDETIPCESTEDYVALPSLPVPTAAPIPTPNTAAPPSTSPTAGPGAKPTSSPGVSPSPGTVNPDPKSLNTRGDTGDQGEGKGLDTLDVVLIVLGSAIGAVLLIVAASWFYIVKRGRKRERDGPAEPLLSQEQAEL